MKVSVIIPMYNAERYLRETLDDVINQSLREIEIILVDDGSTDSTKEIAEQYMEKDSRIQLLSQANLFCGTARNKGMDIASGEYLIFWDADDRFKTNMLELLYKQAKKTDADICICGVEEFDSETRITMPRKASLKIEQIKDKEVFNKYDIPEYIFNITSVQVWNKLYKHSFLKEKKLRFFDGDYAEDVFFQHCALYYAERITYVNKSLMSYRVFNHHSAVMNKSKKQTRTTDIFAEIFGFMKNSGEYELFEISLANRLLGGCISDLENQREFERFCLTYNELKEHVFSDLGLAEKDDTIFRSKMNYQKMKFIMEHEPGDYLLLNYHQIRQKLLNDVHKQRMAKRKKEKLIIRKNKRISLLKDEIQKLEKEVLHHKRTHTEIKNSTSFRLGQLITWIPRKIKKLL